MFGSEGRKVHHCHFLSLKGMLLSNVLEKRNHIFIVISIVIVENEIGELLDMIIPVTFVAINVDDVIGATSDQLFYELFAHELGSSQNQNIPHIIKYSNMNHYKSNQMESKQQSYKP